MRQPVKLQVFRQWELLQIYCYPEWPMRLGLAGKM